MNKFIYLIRGVSGCGKTTFANLISDYVCEADDYFIDKNGNYNFDPYRLFAAHKFCIEKVEAGMKNNISSIAQSNTNVKESDLMPYYELAKKYNYKVISLIVENRHNGKSIHSVPDFKLDEMERKLRNNIKLR